jgi:hypothetical protein
MPSANFFARRRSRLGHAAPIWLVKLAQELQTRAMAELARFGGDVCFEGADGGELVAGIQY